jgi:hypothetical protein
MPTYFMGEVDIIGEISLLVMRGFMFQVFVISYMARPSAAGMVSGVVATYAAGDRSTSNVTPIDTHDYYIYKHTLSK